MKILSCLALTFGITLFITASSFGEEIPGKMFLTRGYALVMALGKNADLKIEALNPAMAETDAAASRYIYNPVLTTKMSTGGRTATFPSRMTTNAAGSVGLSQALPTGGTLSATTDTYYSKDPEYFSATGWTSNAAVTLSQPLLKKLGPEATDRGITVADNNLKESRERFRFTAIDTAYTTVTTYNNLYTLRQLLDSHNTALKETQDLRDKLLKKRRSGPTAQQKIEIANAEFSIAQRIKDIIDADRRVRDQEANLRYLIGMEEKTQLIPIDPPSKDEPKDSEEQSVKKALELRSDIKQLRIALQSSQLQERVTRNLALPDLTLSASAGFIGSGPTAGTSYQQLGNRKETAWSTEILFSMPLGNTAASNDYRKSRIRNEQVQLQMNTLAWKIRNDVEADQRALISARLQLSSTQKSLEFAEERHKEYLKNNLAGTATIQDVINANNDFTTARAAQLDALEAFSNGVQKLWRDTGELLERHNLKLSEVAIK
ncbi:MAG: TolC family protein [Desulfuromonadaceae bacterium]|nr:TolC family protein [Desulfuromonadaceae bacterium]